MIKLDKSIVFFDVETTGLEIGRDKIIEISMVRLNPDGTRDEFNSRFNPGNVEISEGAQKKHGINIEDLRSEPTFSAKVEEIYEFVKDCDLGGYNGNRFDIPMLVEEFIRAGKYFNPRKSSVIDPFIIYTKMEPRTLEGAYQYFTGKTLQNAHAAKADIGATIEIFEAQLEKYDLPSTIGEISTETIGQDNRIDLAGKFRRNDDGTICITFGKHAGKSVAELFRSDPGYLDWMVNKTFMPADTKIIAKKLVEKFSAL